MSAWGRWARIGGQPQADAAAGPGGQSSVILACKEATPPAAASNGEACADAERPSRQLDGRPMRGDNTSGASADASTTACSGATEAPPQALSKEQAMVGYPRVFSGADAGQLGVTGECTTSASITAGPRPDVSPCDAAGDYYVPWHVPFHRVEATLAVRDWARDPHPTPNPDPGPGCLPPAAQVSRSGHEDPHAHHPADKNPKKGLLPAAWAVDREKGTVVLQRYCHLYGPGELEALVQAVPGARVASSCYDRSNWCIVMQVG